MPNQTDSELRWYALQLRPRFEKKVASLLSGKGYEGFLPLYRKNSRWSDRIKEVELPLFDGYMFCNFDVNKRLPILITPGVLRIAGIGKVPQPVDDSEIVALQAVCLSGLQTEPHPYIRVGQKVRIDRGSLSGVEGIIIDDKQGTPRLIISVSLLKRSVSVEMNETWVSSL